MRTWARLTTFAAGIAVLFTAAIGVGQAVGPVRATAPAAPVHADGGHSDRGQGDGGHGDGGQGDGGHGDGGHSGAVDPVGALGVSHDGYTLMPTGPVAFTPGTPAPLSFTITDRSGRPVTDFAVNHDRRLHLVLARRDLSGYQHLHPTMAPDGTWSVALTLPEPGSYRAFADFVPAGREKAITLGVDLTVPGAAEPRPLPQPARTSPVDSDTVDAEYPGSEAPGSEAPGSGYTVELDGHLHAGSADTLRFQVLRDGRPVTDLEPYLGELGHLVILRQGDMGYLHVHATDGLGFSAAAPTPGTYRMYLDFKHEGQVRTAEFTAAVRGGSR